MRYLIPVIVLVSTGLLLEIGPPVPGVEQLLTYLGVLAVLLAHWANERRHTRELVTKIQEAIGFLEASDEAEQEPLSVAQD
jgi:hypothetical protein